MGTAALTRQGFEEFIQQNKQMEEELNAVRSERDELKSANQELTDKYAKVSHFASLADDPPNILQVYIREPRLAQQLIATNIKYHGEAMGNPDASDDPDTQKRARRNLGTLVEDLCSFGLARMEDVFALYMSNPTRRV